jgi:hypothetical protein
MACFANMHVMLYTGNKIYIHLLTMLYQFTKLFLLPYPPRLAFAICGLSIQFYCIIVNNYLMKWMKWKLSLILRMSNGSFSRYIFNSSMCLTSEAIFICPTLNPFSDRRKFMLFSFSISKFWKFSLALLGNGSSIIKSLLLKNETLFKLKML